MIEMLNNAGNLDHAVGRLVGSWWEDIGAAARELSDMAANMAEMAFISVVLLLVIETFPLMLGLPFFVVALVL